MFGQSILARMAAEWVTEKVTGDRDFARNVGRVVGLAVMVKTFDAVAGTQMLGEAFDGGDLVDVDAGDSMGAVAQSHGSGGFHSAAHHPQVRFGDEDTPVLKSDWGRSASPRPKFD